MDTTIARFDPNQTRLSPVEYVRSRQNLSIFFGGQMATLVALIPLEGSGWWLLPGSWTILAFCSLPGWWETKTTISKRRNDLVQERILRKRKGRVVAEPKGEYIVIHTWWKGPYASYDPQIVLHHDIKQFHAEKDAEKVHEYVSDFWERINGVEEHEPEAITLANVINQSNK